MRFRLHPLIDDNNQSNLNLNRDFNHWNESLKSSR